MVTASCPCTEGQGFVTKLFAWQQRGYEIIKNTNYVTPRLAFKKAFCINACNKDVILAFNMTPYLQL